MDVRHLYTNPHAQTTFTIGYEKSDCLFLHAESYSLDPQQILQLMEYVIKNKKKVKQTQNEIVIKDGNNRTTNYPSISRNLINEILAAPVSNAIIKVLSTKIYRDKIWSTSYYYQNKKYHIVQKVYDKGVREEKIAEFDHIYQFSKFSGDESIVFKTDSKTQ